MALSDSLQLSLLMVLTVGAMAFLIVWRQSQRENKEFRIEELKLRKYEIESNSEGARINVQNTNEAPEEEKTDLNGYVFIAVVEERLYCFFYVCCALLTFI